MDLGKLKHQKSPKGKPSKNQSFMTLGCSNRKYFTTEPDIAILYTPWKFNSSPLKKDGWKTILCYWVSVTVQGLFLLNFGRVIVWETDIKNGKNEMGNLIHTPLKFNMEPENHLFEKKNPLPNLHFRVPC